MQTILSLNDALRYCPQPKAVVLCLCCKPTRVVVSLPLSDLSFAPRDGPVSSGYTSDHKGR